MISQFFSFTIRIFHISFFSLSISVWHNFIFSVDIISFFSFDIFICDTHADLFKVFLYWLGNKFLLLFVFNFLRRIIFYYILFTKKYNNFLQRWKTMRTKYLLWTNGLYSAKYFVMWLLYPPSTIYFFLIVRRQRNFIDSIQSYSMIFALNSVHFMSHIWSIEQKKFCDLHIFVYRQQHF